jgi:branched-chain amino acid transport system ATP-binding protein
MLELKEISISYGAIEAVNGISLEVRSGAITALIGANGAGKSSTLRAIAGLVSPASGRVLLDGDDMTAIPAHERARRGVSIAMEGRRLLHHHSVEENLTTAWHFRNPTGDLHEAIERVYNDFPILRERRRVRAGMLSGGQQQMLILSMATLHQPKLVLLDEPSLGLAPIIITQIYDFIREYCAGGDRMVLVSEQMASLPLKVADYAYVLRHGEIALADTAEALREGGLADAYLGMT